MKPFRPQWTLRRNEVEQLVEEVLRELPADFRSLLANLVIVVEEEPADDDYDVLADDDHELVGIFRGTPLPEQTITAPASLPSQIAIFRGPILRTCSSRREAREEIRDTIIHELGHYFGLDDDVMPY